jgi:hypothetical protein
LTHFSVTGGQRTEAQLDAPLAKRVTECEVRLKEHRSALDRFRAFQSLLKLASQECVDLNADDVLFFNLEGADAGEAFE